MSGAANTRRRASALERFRSVSHSTVAVVALLAFGAGAPASDTDRIGLRISGRVDDMNGAPYCGTLRVVLHTPSWTSDDGEDSRTAIYEWLEVHTNALGEFAEQFRTYPELALRSECTVWVLPRSSSGTYLELDEAVASPYFSRGARVTRTIGRNAIGELVVALDSTQLAPAPVVGRLRFQSRARHVSLGVVGYELPKGNGTLPVAPQRAVATNEWLEFRSFSAWEQFRFDCEPVGSETVFETSFERGTEVVVECLPTSSLLVTIDARLPAGGHVDLVATSDGHARRLIAKRASGPGPRGPEPRNKDPQVFASEGYGSSSPVERFDELPDGTYRAEYWPHHAVEAEEPLAVAEFTAPHVGWIALAPR